MAKQYNVFISWSGPRSRHVAQALTKWLPKIIQRVKPWMSESDIDKGARWFNEIGQALGDLKIGIVCLTPENLEAPWILWEGGALSKTFDDRSRLCTYLLAGLKAQDVPPPLGSFQATKSDKEDTRKLLHSINRAVSGDDPLDANTLDSLFDSLWPEFEQALSNMPAVQQSETPERSAVDMLAELIDFVRTEKRERERQRSGSSLYRRMMEERNKRAAEFGLQPLKPPPPMHSYGELGVLTTPERTYEVIFEDGKSILVTGTLVAHSRENRRVLIETDKEVHVFEKVARLKSVPDENTPEQDDEQSS